MILSPKIIKELHLKLCRGKASETEKIQNFRRGRSDFSPRAVTSAALLHIALCNWPRFALIPAQNTR
jgi:hypothetical protein